MKYVITGSLGNISKPLAEKLIEQKHDVTIISSSQNRVQHIEAIGAKAAIGSVQDQDFLDKIFKGADVVYTMVPPYMGNDNWKAHIASIGKNYAAALRTNGVKKVVNLSSIGADLPEGCGPVTGLHEVEEALNALENTDILHLRPGYFYTNLYANIDMIKKAGIMGGNFGAGTSIPLAYPADIAAIASQALINLDFAGKSHLYIISDRRTTDEIAQVLGAAINRELKWVDFPDQASLEAMTQNGLPQEIAANFVEMGAAIRTGKMMENLDRSAQKTEGPTKLENFARVFAGVFSAS